MLFLEPPFALGQARPELAVLRRQRADWTRRGGRQSCRSMSCYGVCMRMRMWMCMRDVDVEGGGCVCVGGEEMWLTAAVQNIDGSLWALCLGRGCGGVVGHGDS